MRNRAFDLIVVGAGPAGGEAALEAARHGLSVVLLDENAAAGGQVHRAPTHPVLDASAEGAALRKRLAESPVTHLAGRSVWHVEPGFSVSSISSAGTERFTAPWIVVATGTVERIVPVPGAATPGVIGLAAATILLKAYGTVPAGPTVVAGVGPLVYAVAAGLLAAGGQVAAVADLASPGDWARRLPALARRPALLAQGMRWISAVRRAGVSIRFRHTVASVAGVGQVDAVTLAPVDQNWRPRPNGHQTVTARALAMGHGLVPAAEIARALGADHRHDSVAGVLVPKIDPLQRSSVAGLYLAGDGTGIAGADAAIHAGRLAGLTAARDAGALDDAAFERAAGLIRKARDRAARVGGAMAQLMTQRPGLLDQVTQDTIVCRCEDVDRAMIEAAATSGARDVNQLKSTTRCGMGPCQGRMCGEVAAGLVAACHGVDRSVVGHWTVRPPLRPVPLDVLLGDYAYDDIPKPTFEPR